MNCKGACLDSQVNPPSREMCMLGSKIAPGLRLARTQARPARRPPHQRPLLPQEQHQLSQAALLPMTAQSLAARAACCGERAGRQAPQERLQHSPTCLLPRTAAAVVGAGALCQHAQQQHYSVVLSSALIHVLVETQCTLAQRHSFPRLGEAILPARYCARATEDG